MTPTNPPPKKAPREWKIPLTTLIVNDDAPEGQNKIHVIEASYAKELEAEIEYLKRSLADERSGDTDLMKTISRHERNIKSLTEKLAVAEAASQRTIGTIIATKVFLKHEFSRYSKEDIIELLNERELELEALASIRGKNG